jgi:GNAT superfamily N-acetyltransferase
MAAVSPTPNRLVVTAVSGTVCAMGEQTTVVPITSANLDAAASTLSRAFADDPILMWMARDRVCDHGRLASAFRQLIEGELRKPDPVLFMTADGGSAAIWQGIDAWKSSVSESIRALPSWGRLFGLGVGRALRATTIMDKVHPTAPHYHLYFVGTDPARQGQGLGTAVLQPMLDRCDTEGVAVYLENSNPRNEALYARFGFVSTGPIPLPKGAPPFTAMWREPRSS